MQTGLLLGTSSALAFTVASPFILNALGNVNVLVAKVGESKASAVMQGDTFHHFIMAYEGHHLNDPRAPWFDRSLPPWEIIDHRPQDDKKYENRNFLLRWSGVYWVGIPPFRSVYRYDFEWNEAEKGPDGKDRIWHRKTDDEGTDFIYVSQFPYEFVLDAGETSEGFPVDVWYQVVLRVTNPYKALFATENWMRVVSAAVNEIARDYVGAKTYQELQSEFKKTDDGKVVFADDATFSRLICQLNTSLPNDDPKESDPYRKGLRGKFGVTIDLGHIQAITMVGPNAAKYVDATVAEVLADKNAYTIRTEGRAKADVVLMDGKAKARVIALQGAAEAYSFRHRLHVLKDAGTLGELLVQTDAMASEGPNKTVVWANNPFIRNAGLADIFDQLGLTPAEAKELLGAAAGQQATSKGSVEA